MPSLVDTNDSTITVRPKKQPQPSAQFQSVFRLKQPLKHNTVARTQNSSFQLAQSSLSSFQDGQAQQYGFHSRRSHRKSRLGCGNCKKRRVKV
ncbi:hypothetical protein BGW36DRAFT_376551 [Talaromyces proteolyticus]|uniref:Uncharacterized protein n=1 Tax=Talaromyces proteolyticus TaxID=1131652 RepID=A0AAD4PWX1_9EURO|nr:uncharacterized protein BGW36DRAFT_376551 [Talaromyces proteolyticus]KAH8698652.1 hypothetical protein BGW36DRAFT_376551 [Talaromyces proteolyticus]